MGWEDIIERNRGRILCAIAPLLAVLGFDQRRRQEVPRFLHRAFISLLRPAESAVRRLIIIAARGIAVKLKPGASRGFPAGLGERLKQALEKAEERFPSFPLIDPLKRSAPAGFGWAQEWAQGWGKEKVIPRISVPGFIDPVFPQPAHVPDRHDPIGTAALLKRIRSLKDALDNLPRHARRLARWKAKSELARQPGAPSKPGRLSPLRPGPAPGLHRTSQRDIDLILTDCHHFAREAWEKADTS